MANAITETVQRFTAETLKAASKQSEGCYVVPLRLRRAIKKYIRDQEDQHMKRKVSRLSESFNAIKDVNLQLTASTARELIEDPLKYVGSSKRWKITSNYGDIGFKYRDDQTIAYVASRMPAVFSACHRVLTEVKRRLPEFTPTKVLDFGAGTGSAFWALREVWPNSVKVVNLIEPSQSMQRAGQSLIKDLKNLPHIQSYGSLQALNQTFSKPDRKDARKHDLVIASYVLGEIPSFKDRITIVRQLWDLTQDVLILMEPGTPHGSDIISQVRSHILWMEKRKSRKLEKASDQTSKDLMTQKCGAHIVAPCPHDGACPLDNSGKYCHFVQRLQRTTSQLAYKQSNGIPLRGFEDEKFSYVVFRRGPRPSETWPLDGMKFDTLKEQRAKMTPEDFESDYDDQTDSEPEDNVEEKKLVKYESDIDEPYATSETDSEEETSQETTRADLGSGWGRIIFSPIKRGKRVEMDVCRATNQDGTEGRFERVIVTKSKNPTLHHQARRSLWGDLWPF
ncbi:putative ribosomal protein Rsm22 [Helianthus annuus]|uniref:Ribosomal protein Rsm22 n=2 Tax=Helianthus annuus TaxID=4232 RepID=A0A9K3EK83_HELAN|nr:methyltransferase-like protein 17, mitochondrial [Helianthus annuus]XP_022002070.1 methyltransferase-like protein 17, mitochondrial [Helianthus annuus]KAF5774695.1 putative ribosomal protein Rsm22 [Helianthus annuus]KAJ0477993.1 putative ribosomal protein Rsm22 [Helianthus annuus]KAJ0498851.1 putative ribosomal protein Rsm22 [Helianthus annuus]KAJ0664865.1 putative ribosomal protein Rsm22 [Helianthus annuus]KAJ0672296.1 putative ribosomal protein Rsm22 [Helianthus annuus]